MENTRGSDGLKYVGDGTQLGNVPTRDLTAEEVEHYNRAWLLNSGLYVEFTKTDKRIHAAPKGTRHKTDESTKENEE